MLLCHALEIEKGVTAVMGSGGKTTLLHVLADQLPGRIVLCTTTRMYPSDTYKTLYDPTPERIREDWARVVCVGSPAENGKLGPGALSPGVLAGVADYVLVESDGSRGLPLKAHAGFEPVIPPQAGQTICVVGASGFGKPVAEVVHRPALWREKDASPAAVGRMLRREGGFTKVFVNQCHDDADFEAARALAKELDCPVFAGSLWEGTVLCLQ